MLILSSVLYWGLSFSLRVDFSCQMPGKLEFKSLAFVPHQHQCQSPTICTKDTCQKSGSPNYTSVRSFILLIKSLIAPRIPLNIDSTYNCELKKSICTQMWMAMICGNQKKDKYAVSNKYLSRIKIKKRNKTKFAPLLLKINSVDMTLEHALGNITLLKHVVEAKQPNIYHHLESNSCYVFLEHQVLS